MNPLDFSGPVFLLFYIVLNVMFIYAGLLLRQYFSGPGGSYNQYVLHPYEVAYLRGGRSLAVSSAIAKLVHLKVLKFRPNDKKFEKIGNKVLKNVHPLEKIICDRFSPYSHLAIDAIRPIAEQKADTLREQLQQNGLIPSNSDVQKAILFPPLLVMCVPALGFIKMVVGRSRGHPTGILFVIYMISCFAPLIIFGRQIYRSRRGQLVLDEMKRGNAALKTTATKRLNELSGDDLVIAISLFGIGVLSSGPLSELKQLLNPPLGTSSCNSGNGCSSGGGCGGGGGGCGGCGGCSGG